MQYTNSCTPTTSQSCHVRQPVSAAHLYAAVHQLQRLCRVAQLVVVLRKVEQSPAARSGGWHGVHVVDETTDAVAVQRRQANPNMLPACCMTCTAAVDAIPLDDSSRSTTLLPQPHQTSACGAGCCSLLPASGGSDPLSSRLAASRVNSCPRSTALLLLRYSGLRSAGQRDRWGWLNERERAGMFAVLCCTLHTAHHRQRCATQQPQRGGLPPTQLPHLRRGRGCRAAGTCGRTHPLLPQTHRPPAGRGRHGICVFPSCVCTRLLQQLASASTAGLAGCRDTAAMHNLMSTRIQPTSTEQPSSMARLQTSCKPQLQANI